MPHQRLLGKLVVQDMTAFIRLVFEDFEDLERDLDLLARRIRVYPAVDIREPAVLDGMFAQ